MSNDLATNSPNKNMIQQSPWKKPKAISLAKSKSIKRKPDLFSSNSNLNDSDSSNSARFDLNNDTENLDQSASKIQKTIFNRFSLGTSINRSYSFTETSSENNSNNDLYSFFNAGKVQDTGSDLSEEKANKKSEQNEKLANICPSLISNIYYSNMTTTHFGLSEPKKVVEEPKVTYLFEDKQLIPIDWSLKVRLRFLSTRPFTCYSGIKSNHESEAILNYSKFNGFYDMLARNSMKSNEENKDLFKTLFCESTSYWTFPYLPWLNLYPRNLNVSNLSSEPLNVDIQKSLSKSWNSCFKSLFNSLKSNQCPYFYVLTQSFVVLFRAQNICGMEEIHAILTPSTKGLRQLLKDIDFTMPLMPSNMRKSDSASQIVGENNSVSNGDCQNDLSNASESNQANFTAPISSGDEINSDSNSNHAVDDDLKKANGKKEKLKNADDDDDEEDEEDEEDSDEPDEWLEQIGLNSTVNFKASTLQRNNKDAQKDSFLNFDNRPRSTLLFTEGGDVQALFNFLLNSKVCVASSGPLSGVPPTLLSPTPFLNATLQKVKVEQNIVKSLTSAGSSLTQYALDFIGPLMPFHIHRLCNLFRLTQSNDFEMVANPLVQSMPLNCVKKCEEPKRDGDANEDDDNDDDNEITSYLDKSELDSVKKWYGLFGEANAIKSITVKDDKFCCN